MHLALLILLLLASHFCSKQPNAAKKVKFVYHCAGLISRLVLLCCF